MYVFADYTDIRYCTQDQNKLLNFIFANLKTTKSFYESFENLVNEV